MTTPTDVAQALRELSTKWRSQGEAIGPSVGHLARTYCADDLDALLEAHESRAQPASWPVELQAVGFNDAAAVIGYMDDIDAEVARITGDEGEDSSLQVLRRMPDSQPAQPASVQSILADMRRTASADASGIEAAILGWADGIEASIPAQPASVADGLADAAKALRAAQRAYMADRGNELLGKAVGVRAAELDDAILAYTHLPEPARDAKDGRTALDDALQFGTGFTVDGKRIDPSRVCIYHGHPKDDAAMAQESGE